MPSSRPSRHWRSAVLALAVLMMGLLLGPAGVARADPYAVAGEPVLSVPTEVVFVLGRAGDTYEIEADGDPVPAIGVERLPPGLRLTAHGDGSAAIEGTPTGPAGSTTVTVTAHNAAGSTSAAITVDVQQSPAFLDQGPVTFIAGQTSAVVVHTVGYPAPGIGVEGDLPPGLDFVDNGNGTATIFGTPAVGSPNAPITLTAINVVADAALTTTIVVLPRPMATGGLRLEP